MTDFATRPENTPSFAMSTIVGERFVPATAIVHSLLDGGASAMSVRMWASLLGHTAAARRNGERTYEGIRARAVVWELARLLANEHGMAPTLYEMEARATLNAAAEGEA